MGYGVFQKMEEVRKTINGNPPCHHQTYIVDSICSCVLKEVIILNIPFFLAEEHTTQYIEATPAYMAPLIIKRKNTSRSLGSPPPSTPGNQSCGWMIRGTVISPANQGSNPGARIIPGFISGFPVMRFQWEETFPSTTRHLR